LVTSRDYHEAALREEGEQWNDLFDPSKGGLGKICQPFFGYLGAISTLIIVFVFKTVSLWNGERLTVKAIGAFVSPALVLSIFLVKKLLRWRRPRIGITLKDYPTYRRCLEDLNVLVHPGAFQYTAAHGSDVPLHKLRSYQSDAERSHADIASNANQGATHGDPGLEREPPNFGHRDIVFNTVHDH